mmetsp:Transcript_11133/g.36644  ORF Transcript_11133/g.36644 Transcript_11133/m.36644 type:complete len:212 (+) Transcript_11133:88-723(+)
MTTRVHLSLGGRLRTCGGHEPDRGLGRDAVEGIDDDGRGLGGHAEKGVHGCVGFELDAEAVKGGEGGGVEPPCPRHSPDSFADGERLRTAHPHERRSVGKEHGEGAVGGDGARHERHPRAEAREVGRLEPQPLLAPRQQECGAEAVAVAPHHKRVVPRRLLCRSAVTAALAFLQRKRMAEFDPRSSEREAAHKRGRCECCGCKAARFARLW